MPEELHTGTDELPAPELDGAWQREIGGIRVLFGAGRLRELGRRAAELTGQRVLLVTDPGLVACGHAAVAADSLRQAGLEVHLFDAVSPNPTTLEVDAGTKFATGKSIEMIVAVGGGSAMDCAKGINFLLTNGGQMEDYWGFGKASRELLPAIGVPTTAGTGSDAQSYALISHATTHRKMACGDLKARFRIVILDPELLATVPRQVAATAGMDALSHSLESYVTTARSPASVPQSRLAFQLLEPAIESVANATDEGSPDARRSALLGAHLAGAGIESSMLGAAHAAANPLTSRHGVAHGAAIGLMLPAVIRFNAVTEEALYRELWPAGSEALAKRVEQIRHNLGLPATLAAVGIGSDDIADLATRASDERTGRFNPRPLATADFEEMYASSK